MHIERKNQQAELEFESNQLYFKQIPQERHELISTRHDYRSKSMEKCSLNDKVETSLGQRNLLIGKLGQKKVVSVGTRDSLKEGKISTENEFFLSVQMLGEGTVTSPDGTIQLLKTRQVAYVPRGIKQITCTYSKVFNELY